VECGQGVKFRLWSALKMVQLLLFTWNLPPRVRDGVALTRGQAGCAHTTSAEGNGIPSGGHGIKFLVPKIECSVHLLVSYRKIGSGHGTKGHFLAVPGRFGRARN